MVSQRYSLDELAAAAGMTARNVRAYRARGLVDPPRRHGRKGYYGPGHLGQLRTVQALLSRGLSLADIEATVAAGSTERALLLLLADPVEPGRRERLDRFGTLMDSTLHTVAEQRPGTLEHLVDLGIVHAGEDGSYLADTGLLALANQLLADGTRLRVVVDILEGVGSSAPEVAGRLRGIARAAGGRDPATYADLATWAFREALRHALSTQT